MADFVEIAVYTKVVGTLLHNDRWYSPTGKYGSRLRNGDLVFEFACQGHGFDYRLWARADGSEIEED